MKIGLAGVRVYRYTNPVAFGEGGGARESKVKATWADATALALEWSKDPATSRHGALYFRPRWKNGLALYEVRIGMKEQVRALLTVTHRGLGGMAEAECQHYALNKRLGSSKAVLARECYHRCAFSDTEALESSEDGIAFDHAARALKTCFPDDAQRYIDRIRAWMLDGGRIK